MNIQCLTLVSFFFLFLFLCREARESVQLASLSGLLSNGTGSLISQSAVRILDHVGHDKCILLEHTEIAAHMLNTATLLHCSVSGASPAPSAHTTQMYFLHFPRVWIGSICSHPTRGWRYYWTPGVTEACRLVTFVKCWLCVFQLLEGKKKRI